MTLPALDGWVPCAIAWQSAQPMVDWCYLGAQPFSEPFFEDTIQLRMRNPFNLLFRHQTPMDALLEWAEVRPGIPPTGFIFHLSRCGSTLVSQMLAAAPEHVVISEAGPIDAVLRPYQGQRQVADADKVRWLRAMISALGQPRRGVEQRLFVKFDCWHAMHLPLIRQAFPEVPWIFVHRDPVEILVSQLRRPAGWTFPGTLQIEGIALDPDIVPAVVHAEYCTRVLARIAEAALKQLESGSGLAVNYRDLPQAVETVLSDHFHVECSRSSADLMREAARFDAKNPSFEFASDSQEKQGQASDVERRLATAWLTPLYQRLEHVRPGALSGAP